MDEMTEWEINDYIDYIPYLDRNLWESQRLEAYVIAQVNSRKTLNQTDICKFKWDSEDDLVSTQEEHITEISNEDIARLKAKASKIMDLNKNEEQK